MRSTLALLLAATLALGGCSGDDPASEDRPPADVLAAAKRTLDETSGVRIGLAAEQLPDGLSAVVAADGIGTHPPAFDGTLTVTLNGSRFDVPVVAVDGHVYAQVPLVPGWSDVDPGEYGAPDPAQLLSPDDGLSSLLTATEQPAAGESVRGGEGNEEVLTEYTGTVPGDVVAHVIPGASGTFDATYRITDDDLLRTAELTGVFYPDTDPMTYTIDFDDYGVEKDITAP